MLGFKKKNPNDEAMEIEEFLLAVILFAMLAICSAQVFWRYILRSSLGWSEELARYLFVWLIWLGAAYAAKKGRHLRITFVKEMVPQKYRHIFDTFAMLMMAVFAGVVGFVSIDLIQRVHATNQLSPAMLLPMWIPYIAVPLGLWLIVFRSIQNIYLIYRPVKSSLNDEEEGAPR